MSESNVYFFQHDDVIPPYRQVVKGELLLPLSGRNSAPSRLENFGEFQAKNLESSAEETNLKSTSLTNLFSRQPHSYDDTFDAHGLSNDFIHSLTGSMQFKNNESDGSSLPNPILNGTFLPRTCHDPNNNDDTLDDSDTISQSSSTSLEPSDDHCCFVSKSECQKGGRSDGFGLPNWRRLIRHDTFNLDVLGLDKKESDFVTSGVKCDGKMTPMTSLVTSEKNEEDAESISSLSSDDT